MTALTARVPVVHDRNRSSVPGLALSRARTEIGLQVRSPRAWASLLGTTTVFLTIAWYSGGSDDPLMRWSVCVGGLAAVVVLNSWVTMAQAMSTERAEGVLLRLRSLPRATLPYLLATTAKVGWSTLMSVLLIAGGGLLVLGAPAGGARLDVLVLLGVVVLGLAATVPAGAALGAALPNPREALGAVMLPVMGLISASGLFFSPALLPDAVLAVVRLFPPLWIGEGLRLALLGSDATTVWSAGGALAVLGTWTLVGFLLVPPVLARAARRPAATTARRAA